MPCRTELFHCSFCGAEHYYEKECLTNPSKYREGLAGYNAKTAAVEGKKAIAKMKEAKQKNFNVEGALCDVLTLLEDKGLLKTASIPPDILEWWNGHQAREKQKIKREALAKLSSKEKRALGLK